MCIIFLFHDNQTDVTLRPSKWYIAYDLFECHHHRAALVIIGHINAFSLLQWLLWHSMSLRSVAHLTSFVIAITLMVNQINNDCLLLPQQERAIKTTHNRVLHPCIFNEIIKSRRLRMSWAMSKDRASLPPHPHEACVVNVDRSCLLLFNEYAIMFVSWQNTDPHWRTLRANSCCVPVGDGSADG